MTNSSDTKDILESFEETIERSELKGVAVDVAEIGLDYFIDDPTLKELPIIRTFMSFVQTGINVHDKLFLKKLLSFLNGIENTSLDNRERLINQINKSKKYRLRVGEKLLFIIDKCGDYESSELVAKIFSSYLEGIISYEDYVIASEIISANTAADIRWFIEEYSEAIDVDDLNVPIYTGLYMIATNPIDVYVDNSDDYKAIREGANPIRTTVSGGDVLARPSRAGEIIYKVLKDTVHN